VICTDVKVFLHLMNGAIMHRHFHFKSGAAVRRPVRLREKARSFNFELSTQAYSSNISFYLILICKISVRKIANVH